ncbi:MAG TPA: hypothetical protein VKP30_30910 [Polyangiaceae bacterium]|nr:hypothetical protein [Polyangiaceae bacterium]
MQPVHLRELDAHVFVVAIALVLDRLVDIDAVHEAEAAAQVQPLGQPEVDALFDPTRARDVPLAHRVEARPQHEKRRKRAHDDQTKTSAPARIDEFHPEDPHPDHDQTQRGHRPEGVVIASEGRAHGTECRTPKHASLHPP